MKDGRGALSCRARLAAKECESMLRLCSRDNLGIRYTLTHIYAYLEEEKAAQKIFKKYHGAEERRLPLAMALLSYVNVNEKVSHVITNF